VSRRFTANNRQGIRSLDNLPTKKVTRKVELPVGEAECPTKHISLQTLASGEKYCLDCDQTWAKGEEPEMRR